MRYHQSQKKMNEAAVDSLFPKIVDGITSYHSPLTPIISNLRRKNAVTASVAAAAAASVQHVSLQNSIDPWKASETFGLSLNSANDGGEMKPWATSSKADEDCTCSLSSTSPGARASWTGARYGARRSSIGFTTPGRVKSTSGSTPSPAVARPPSGSGPGMAMSPSSSTPSNGSRFGGNKNERICPKCAKRIQVREGGAWENRPRKQLSSWAATVRTDWFGPPKHAASLLKTTPHLRTISATLQETKTVNLAVNLAVKTTVLNFFNKSKAQPSKDAELEFVDGDQLESSTTYRASIVRHKANKRAATELSSLLWILAHEMSLEHYGVVESEVFSSVFALIHSNENNKRMAGLAALDALIDAPSADEEKKAIKFANTLSNGLRSSNGDFEFFSAVSRALGHMATRTSNVDFVESELTRALEWLRTERSDRRLAACLALKEFAIHAPTSFYSKTSQAFSGLGPSNEFLDHIFYSIRDPQPVVRVCAADALSYCLRILIDRRHRSLTGILCQLHFALMDGFELQSNKPSWHAHSRVDAAQHGSLLVVATMLAHTGDFMLPRFDEVCRHVLALRNHSLDLIQLEVIRLIPRLARRFPKVFARRYLDESVVFLIDCAKAAPQQNSSTDLRPSSFTALGLLVLSMVDDATGEVIGGPSLQIVKIREDPESQSGIHTVEVCKQGIIHQELDTIFGLLRDVLTHGDVASSNHSAISETHTSVFQCAANLVEALGTVAVPYIKTLIDDMFQAGLSNDLIHCLHAIGQNAPSYQKMIEDRLFQEVSKCLVGRPESAKLICDPLVQYRPPARNEVQQSAAISSTSNDDPDFVSIVNPSVNPQDVKDIVLSLETLSSFGDSMGRVTTSGEVVPLLPFIQQVASQYLSHPSSEVRKGAALTCCVLLVPPGMAQKSSVIGQHSGKIIEGVLCSLLQLAVSDLVPVVRFCIVRALDSRYDSFLCQANHLRSLFLILYDENVTTRAAVVMLLGRLAALNPGQILPHMRRFLLDLIFELESGVGTGRGREEATRLLVVFLRAKPFQRLVPPFLPSLVRCIPLDGSTPRLVSAALEALGELAKATGPSLKPWIPQIIPTILETLQDQSSASKQQISLKTLAQIAGSTGYIIQPYIDYPMLLTQASDILPATKRAPWSLRKEVIRTLGVLGALDPDRCQQVALKTRQGGVVGGAYFITPETPQEDTDKEITFHGGSINIGTGTTAHSLSSHARIISKLSMSSKGQAMVMKRASSIGNIHQMQRNQSTGGIVTSANTQHTTTIGDGGNASNNVTPIANNAQPAHLFMYEQYAMVAIPDSSLSSARRMTLMDKDFFPTIAIHALMKIFRDPSLAVHHGMVMQAIMFIFKSLGLQCVQFLKIVVPHILHAIRTLGSLRESLLKQVATLCGIVRERLRPYVQDIFDIIEHFWDSKHLGTIFALISHLSISIPGEFRDFVPRLIGRILASLDSVLVSDWTATSQLKTSRLEKERVRLILSNLQKFRTVLVDHLHVLVPTILNLSDSIMTLLGTKSSVFSEKDLHELLILSFEAVSSLLECEGTSTSRNKTVTPFWGNRGSANIRSGSLSARVSQSLTRILVDDSVKSYNVGFAIVSCLCTCARQLGPVIWVKLYHNGTRDVIQQWEELNFRRSQPAESTEGKRQLRPANASSCLKMFDSAIEELTNSPLQRSYNNPSPITNPRPLRHQDSSMIFGSDQLQSQGLMVDASSHLLQEPFSDGFDATMLSPAFRQPSTGIMNTTQENLQKVWDVSKCSSREDWDEWMRQLAIHLLREASSPALRAAATLAHVYQPLARELFSAAFVCCWKELSDGYRADLVQALQTAFVADVSPEILQTLLNLAEFMEHDPDGGLPINIAILADLALKCRAYAKALHYKERESRLGSKDCVEALISINRKLDLQEAALGVLKSATVVVDSEMSNEASMISSKWARHQSTHELLYGIVWSSEHGRAEPQNRSSLNLAENKELWLAKLGSWTEALEVYERKLAMNRGDFDALLGCMRCSSAIGEWSTVLDLADTNWSSINNDSMALSVEGVRSATSRARNLRGQRKALTMCAKAAWRLKRWDELEKYSKELLNGRGDLRSQTSSSHLMNRRSTKRLLPDIDNYEGSFYTAVLRIHRQEWDLAAESIDSARRAMDGPFTASMAESYNRAYPSMVSAQSLAEMEEIIEYRKLEKMSMSNQSMYFVDRPEHEIAKEKLLSVWRDRLTGCRVDAEVHSTILAVRSLILGPIDEVENTLTLSKLYRQAQRSRLAGRVILDPLAELRADLDGPAFGFGIPSSWTLDEQIQRQMETVADSELIHSLVRSDAIPIAQTFSNEHKRWTEMLVEQTGGRRVLEVQHQLYFAYLKHLWLADERQEATQRLSKLCTVVDVVSSSAEVADTSFQASCWLRLGEWQLEISTALGAQISKQLQVQVLAAFQRSTKLDSSSYKSWHAWAQVNFRIAQQSNPRDVGNRSESSRQEAGLESKRIVLSHIKTAVRGYINAISLGTKRWSASVQQDMLNFLTCLFNYGKHSEIAAVIRDIIGSVTVEAWLGVLPQMLARIHIQDASTRSILHGLLTTLGEKHPQALMYPLSVLMKSPIVQRRNAAALLMNTLKAHSSALVEEASMVSSELIRVAILWLETWLPGLDDASKLYYGDGNIVGMLDILLPLHEQIEKGGETQYELEFIESFGHNLEEALNGLKKYLLLVGAGEGDNATVGYATCGAFDDYGRQIHINEDAEMAINNAWESYYKVFRLINKQLIELKSLKLSACSQALFRARSLELGVPGSYRVDGSYVKIERFIPTVEVFTSKQRPRKVTVRGSDGRDYVFLLKGHEDLRQDERVMQLFGLVNALLERERQSDSQDLMIQRYTISPLSYNCGLVGWVPHTDTMHVLVKNYRQSKQIPVSIENHEMSQITRNYEDLTVMQKVEVFTDALERTPGKGNDMYEILWLKSTNSEEWLEHRTRYTRSLAVMSMVGYMLGLGDRHPSNLMLDQISGRILHIDFGDCFEVAMKRDKFPEKVPFRLTRMLVEAMGVSKIEGTYRSTCERTMVILRENRDSLLTMLEAFLYDPLISSRLIELEAIKNAQRPQTDDKPADGGVASSITSPAPAPSSLRQRQRKPRFRSLSFSDRLANHNKAGKDHAGQSLLVHQPIQEESEEGATEEQGRDRPLDLVASARNTDTSQPASAAIDDVTADGPATKMNTAKSMQARSLKLHSSIQSWAAERNIDPRVASVVGDDEDRVGSVVASNSVARSRTGRSLLQRELMSLMEGENDDKNDEAFNQQALKVVRRVQDKLVGTDFPDAEESGQPLDVVDQVQRLIVQSTSTENLCQSYVGWCAFW